MSRKRRTAQTGVVVVSSLLLAALSLAALGFGLWSGLSVSRSDAPPAPVAEAAPEAKPQTVVAPPVPSRDVRAVRLHTETAKLLAKHPQLHLDEMAASSDQVEVIAVDGGTESSTLGQRELIALHITRDEPFFLVLLSDGAVAYDVQTSVSNALRGVLISSDQPSTIVGLPERVPLEIVSDGGGVARPFRRPEADAARAALEDDLREIFPKQELGITEHGDSPVILVR